MLAVLYARAIDDKELGIYLDGVFWGGAAKDQEEADELARECTNTVKGGAVIVKVFEIHGSNSLTDLALAAKRKFAQTEADMMQAEMILEDNIAKSKRRKK